jgi:NAD(P)-dependent dehydrogenase (short-subunit alcohol dehydrogenase family)
MLLSTRQVRGYATDARRLGYRKQDSRHDRRCDGRCGLPAARELASRGARLVLIARNRVKAERAGQAIRREARNVHLAWVWCDLARLSDIARASDEIRAQAPRIDVLINNAGVMKSRATLSPDGFEVNIAVKPARGCRAHAAAARQP